MFTQLWSEGDNWDLQVIQQSRKPGELSMNFYLKVSLGNAGKIMHFHLQYNCYRFTEQKVYYG